MPTPSSTMPMARQLPSRLRQCGAKPARQAPTWDPSTLSGRGRRRNLARLLASLEWSWTGPSGASSIGRLLCHNTLRRGGRGPQAVKDWRSRSRLLGWRHFHAGGFSILLVESQTSQPSCQLAWWHGHDSEGPLDRDRPHGCLQTVQSAQKKELGAGSSGEHLDAATAGSTRPQSLRTPRKLVLPELWPTSPGEV